MIKTQLLLSSALITVTLCAAAPSYAQTSRIYLAGYLGLNTYNDQEFTESSTASSGDLELDNATSFAGAIGLRLSRSMRMEGELSYTNAEFKTIDLAGSGTFNNGGELKSTFAFLNLYYDFDVPWKVQPFIGGGIGYGWHSGEIVDGTGSLPNASTDSSALAWNVGGGVKYRPRTDFAFTGSYRYVDSMDLNFGTYDLDFGSHEFRLGLEWDLPVR